MFFLASFLQNHGPKTAGLLIEKQINALCHSLMGPQELFGEILRRKVRQMTPRWMSRSPLYLVWPGALSWFFQNVSLNTAQASCIPMAYQVSFFASCPCVGRRETKLCLFVPCVFKLQTDNDDACCCPR